MSCFACAGLCATAEAADSKTNARGAARIRRMCSPVNQWLGTGILVAFELVVNTVPGSQTQSTRELRFIFLKPIPAGESPESGAAWFWKTLADFDTVKLTKLDKNFAGWL